MLIVEQDGFEIGYVSGFKTPNNDNRFQGIFPTSSGKICSKVFDNEEEGRSWVISKYKETGYVPFYRHLRKAVENSGLAHHVIGLEIGCSRASITKWLAGEQYPAVHFLLRLTNVLFPRNKAQARFVEWAEIINQERK